MGGSYQQSRVATTADTATVPTNTAGGNIKYEVGGKLTREGAADEAGGKIDYVVGEAEFNSAVEKTTVKSHHEQASVSIPVYGSGVSVNMGGGSGAGESTTHVHGYSRAQEVSLTTTGDAALIGHTLQGEKSTKVDVEGNMRIETPQDTRSYDGSSFSIGFTIPTSSSADAEPAETGPSLAEWISSPATSAQAVGDKFTGETPDHRKPGLDSVGGSYQKDRTKQATQVSGVFGGESSEVNVGGKLSLIGGAVASATQGGAKVTAGDFESQDLDNKNKSFSLGGTLNFKRDSAGDTYGTLSGDLTRANKESTTRATVTTGDIEIAGEKVDPQSLNRDVDNVEEVHKDESYKARIYVPGESVTETLKDIADEVSDVAAAISNQPGVGQRIEQQQEAMMQEARNLAEKELGQEANFDQIETAAEILVMAQNLEKLEAIRKAEGKELSDADVAAVMSGYIVKEGVLGAELVKPYGIERGKEGEGDWDAILNYRLERITEEDLKQAKKEALHAYANKSGDILEVVEAYSEMRQKIDDILPPMLRTLTDKAGKINLPKIIVGTIAGEILEKYLKDGFEVAVDEGSQLLREMENTLSDEQARNAAAATIVLMAQAGATKRDAKMMLQSAKKFRMNSAGSKGHIFERRADKNSGESAKRTKESQAAEAKARQEKVGKPKVSEAIKEPEIRLVPKGEKPFDSAAANAKLGKDQPWNIKSEDQLYKLHVYGTGQDTKTPGHRFKMYKKALEAMKEPDTSKVYLDSTLKKVTGGKIDPSRQYYRPDVSVVKKDGTLNQREVMSKSDKEKKLLKRMELNNEALPEEMRGTIQVDKIGSWDYDNKQPKSKSKGK
jgi:hypothetical protein